MSRDTLLLVHKRNFGISGLDSDAILSREWTQGSTLEGVADVAQLENRDFFPRFTFKRIAGGSLTLPDEDLVGFVSHVKSRIAALAAD
jgi:hypothetical protein